MVDMRKPSVDEVDLQKEAIGEVIGVEANPAAAALAAATEAQKPRMFSRGMIRLWLIVSVLCCAQVTLINPLAGICCISDLNDERLR